MPIRRIRRKARKSRKKAKRIVRSVRPITRNNFLQTKRFVIPLIIAGSDALSAGVGVQTFSFDQIPAYTEFTNTFDQYKIAGISYRWVCIRSADQTGTTLAGTLGLYTRVMWAYDWNDNSSPSGGAAELQQYDTCKEVFLTNARPVTRWYFFKPKPLLVAASGYMNTRRTPFLRINETNTPHYSIKYYYDSNQSSQQLRLECKYYFQLKSIK